MPARASQLDELTSQNSVKAKFSLLHHPVLRGILCMPSYEPSTLYIRRSAV
jgi:hypothetical protein